MGRAGARIKAIGTAARKELERFFDARVFLEVHPDVYHRAEAPSSALAAFATQTGLHERIDWERAAQLIERAEGLAREVTRATPLRTGTDSENHGATGALR